MLYGIISYLFNNEKFLIIQKIKRKDDPNSEFCTLPGGKLTDLERGFNSAGRLEAAIRETQEETGLTLINPKLRGIILFNNTERVFDNWPNPQDYLVYVFYSNHFSGKLKKESDEGIPMWVDKISISKLPKNSGDEKIYEWLKDGRYFVGTIKHKGKVLDEFGTFVDYFN